MEHFHTLDAFVRDFYDQNSRLSRFTGKTEEELLVWQEAARKTLCECTGLDLLLQYFGKQNFGMPQPQVAEICEAPDYVRTKLYLQIEQNMVVPVYQFMPKDMKAGERRPVVLAPHGHGSCGKYSTAGITGKFDLVDDAIKTYDYSYGEYYAKQGYIVFCPDAPGFGERRERWYQTDDMVLKASCEVINHMVYSMGLSMQGIEIHNLMRLADYALSLPEADTEKLYCIGLSGGGLQTLMYSACDPRVKKSIISGYFYGVKESLLLMPQNCSCNFSHRLWYHFDMGDIACLIYPNPILIETGDVDNLNGASGIANVTSQVEITRAAYALGGKADLVEHHVYPGPHKWYGFDADAFLKK